MQETSGFPHDPATVFAAARQGSPHPPHGTPPGTSGVRGYVFRQTITDRPAKDLAGVTEEE